MKLASRIEALIFDMGGTLYCPTIDHAILKEYFLNLGGFINEGQYTFSEIKGALIKPDLWLTEYMIEQHVDSKWEPDFDTWVEYEKMVFEELSLNGDPKASVKIQQSRLFDALDYFEHRITDDCLSVLDNLRERGYRIGLASNRFGDPTPHLERSSILEYFEVIEYSQVPGYKKPSPYLLLRVAEQLQLNPLSCAYIGDNINADLPAAQRADMLPILITQCGSKTPTNVPDGTLKIESLSELLNYFR
jgi:HAD superfamily hydrolase (TIGR01549 family)